MLPSNASNANNTGGASLYFRKPATGYNSLLDKIFHLQPNCIKCEFA